MSDRNTPRKGIPQERRLPALAGTYEKGKVALLHTTDGLIGPFSSSTGLAARAVGIFGETKTVTTTNSEDVTVLTDAVFFFDLATTSNAPHNGDAGKPAYFTDDHTVSDNNVSSNKPIGGRIDHVLSGTVGQPGKGCGVYLSFHSDVLSGST